MDHIQVGLPCFHVPETAIVKRLDMACGAYLNADITAYTFVRFFVKRRCDDTLMSAVRAITSSRSTRVALDNVNQVLVVRGSEEDRVVTGPYKVLEELKHDQKIEDERKTPAPGPAQTQPAEDAESESAEAV